MTILVNKVLEILGNMSDIDYVMFDNNMGANVRIDRKNGVGALLYTMPDWTLDISKGQKKENLEIEVFIFKPIAFDCKGEDKIDTIEEMSIISYDFISELLNDGDIRVLDDSINVKSCYGQFDKFVAGVSVQIRIEEKQGSCLIVDEEEIEQETTNNADNEENQG